MGPAPASFQHHHNKLRVAVLARAGVVPIAVAPALTLPSTHLPALTAAVALAWATSGLHWHRASQGAMTRNLRRFLTGCDVLVLMLASVAGASSTALGRLPLLSFPAVLALAAYMETHLRITEVSVAAAMTTATYTSIAYSHGLGSWETATALTALNTAAVVAWWKHPLHNHRLHASRTYIHDLRGFLASARWALEADSPHLRAEAINEICRYASLSTTLEELLSTPVLRTRPRPYRLASVLLDAGVLPNPEEAGVDPRYTVSIDTSALTTALTALATASIGPPTAAMHKGRLSVVYAARPQSYITATALALATLAMPHPHKVSYDAGKLIVTLKPTLYSTIVVGLTSGSERYCRRRRSPSNVDVHADSAVRPATESALLCPCPPLPTASSSLTEVTQRTGHFTPSRPLDCLAPTELPSGPSMDFLSPWRS